MAITGSERIRGKKAEVFEYKVFHTIEFHAIMKLEKYLSHIHKLCDAFFSEHL